MLGTYPTGYAPQTHNMANINIKSQTLGTYARNSSHRSVSGLRPTSLARNIGKLHQKLAFTGLVAGHMTKWSCTSTQTQP
jgi:hypothetical protein